MCLSLSPRCKSGLPGSPRCLGHLSLPPRSWAFSQLLPTRAQRSTWIIYHFPSLSIPMLQPLYFMHRAERPLCDQRRACCFDPPTWFDSTLPLAAILTQLPHLPSCRATRVNCLLLRCHLSVKSNLSLASPRRGLTPQGKFPLSSTPRPVTPTSTGQVNAPTRTSTSSVFLRLCLRSFPSLVFPWLL